MIKEDELVLLRRVNRVVNNMITYVTDLEHYGVKEKWVVNPRDNRGDCEDYALTKMNRLVRSGIAPNRMGIAVVRVNDGRERGQIHAVLVVDNVWVLDNRNPNVITFTASKYTLLYVVRP